MALDPIKYSQKKAQDNLVAHTGAWTQATSTYPAKIESDQLSMYPALLEFIADKKRHTLLMVPAGPDFHEFLIDDRGRLQFLGLRAALHYQ
ncbi:acetolactate synthase precursor [Fusarium flagelliforme]|uniref:Acetolactate synthase n=1 Tax=Fusarium flagelliforme TaxID=2675880 RepID=A0A395M6X8_9HYPO|nr:acetolactate synthase precursor [Fusarium flagelliforme]